VEFHVTASEGGREETTGRKADTGASPPTLRRAQVMGDFSPPSENLVQTRTSGADLVVITATLGNVGRSVQIFDSRFLSRVGNALTLGRVLGLGAALIVALGLVGAQAVHVAGWIPVVCFGVWTVVACLLGATWLLQRDASSIASPTAQLAIELELPRASVALLNALQRAETRGREFIAEAAILNPVNNQGAAAALARSYSQFEKEVASVLTATAKLDERWELAWAHKPSWADDHLLEPAFTRARLDVIVKYMAHRNRQLGWMIEYLRSGDDEPVRYIRHWVSQNEAATVGAAPHG
jgi:hypothetical protein